MQKVKNYLSKENFSKNFFTIFMVVYLGFLISHALHEISWILFFGIALAVWSHANRNVLTPVILLGHMIVEWVEWVHSPAKLFEWLFRFFHTGMDITFFRHELNAHAKTNKRYWIFFSTLIFVGAVSSSFTVEIPENIMEVLHPLVLGGTMGCVASHLYFHTFKENKQKAKAS